MKSLGIHELAEHINDILRLVEEEGETIEITNRGKIIARLVPVSKPQPSIKHELTPFWEKMEQLATEIGTHWKDDVSAVEAIRDVRREL